MRSLGALRRITCVHCCAAIGCISCCVVARVCHCSFSCLGPMFMMPLAPGLFSLGLSCSIGCGPASSAWTRDIGACGRSPGYIRRWLRWPSYPGTQTPTQPLLPAAYLDRRRGRQAHGYRALLWARLPVLSPPASPLWGWSAVARRVALTYAATIAVALAAQQAGHLHL